MDRQPHDYAAAAASGAMAFAQQQRPGPPNMPPQQFGFHPQQQQFTPPSMQGGGGGPPFFPQQFPYPAHLGGQQQRPPHHLMHLPHQQAFPPHLPPPHQVPSFPGVYDAPPPPAPPPSDPELHKRIDKLVEYAAKNGPEFEAMIREKQKDNPEYGFLFGGEGHGYYWYKLWISTHSHPSGGPFNAPFPHSSMPGLHLPSPSHMMSPSHLNAPPMNAASSSPIMGASQMHQPPFPPYFEQHPRPYIGHGLPDYDQSNKPFRGHSGPLPPDVSVELNNVLNSLTGTKESIKGAKMWFMQRSLFVPALAEALRERVFALDDSERQLHIIYLSNDILFDSLQRRNNPQELDNEALAFKPVLGSMLARVCHNPQNKEENQSRLQKILQFWASKEVYDQNFISALEAEMIGGPPKEFAAKADSLMFPGLPQQTANQNLQQWQSSGPNFPGQVHPDKQLHPIPSLANQQFIPNSVPPCSFPGSMPISSSVQPVGQQPAPANAVEKLSPYPLFPPGLIPGMVRKMQIGSGVPYTPLSPLDIPTVIPPSDIPQSDILQRVSKFFKEIGEVNPSEGPITSDSKDDYEDYERSSPIRKGGACIPPPPNLQLDPETGAYADGSMEQKGSGRLGLGAIANPNEVNQYDDVYSSYRKQRSSNYHSSMSTRAATR